MIAQTLRARGGVGLQRAPALDGVVDDRRRVPGLPRRRQQLVGDILELGHPAAHVGAVRVVAALLEHRVVEAARDRRRIDADRRDPLPVAVVVGLVAVEQQAHEVLLAAAPVDVQVLDQKARRDQPRAVVHPARRGELAHARVDDGIARAALAPGVEVLVGAVPLDAVEVALMSVARVGRVVEQDVGIEVAPGELAGERVVATRLLLQFARGDAAEVQVWRERRRAAGQPVVVGRVAVDAVAQPRVHSRTAGLLAARAGLDLRQLADAQVRGHRDLARRAVDIPARQLLPGAPERREHRVRLRLADVGHEVAGRAARLDARFAQRVLDPAVTRERIRRDVGGEIDGARAVLTRQLRQLALGRAAGHHEVPAALTQRGAQLVQALVQERRSVLGRVAAAQQRVVEHEDGDDALTRVERRTQWRVIVDAQVAPEPDEAEHRSGYGRRLRLDPRGGGPELPAVPAGHRRAAERADPAAHLRGALQGDDRALPRGGVGVRDRLARRRRPAAGRLRLRGRRGARADARRPAEHRRARHARVPDRGTPGRVALPGRNGRVPRRSRRGARLRGRCRRAHRLR